MAPVYTPSTHFAVSLTLLRAVGTPPIATLAYHRSCTVHPLGFHLAKKRFTALPAISPRYGNFTTLVIAVAIEALRVGEVVASVVEVRGHPSAHHRLIASHRCTGLANKITSPGIGSLPYFPQTFGATTPCDIISPT